MIKPRPLQEKQPLPSAPQQALLPSCLLRRSAFGETTQIPDFLTALVCFLFLSLRSAAKPGGRRVRSKQRPLTWRADTAAAPHAGCGMGRPLPSGVAGCRGWDGKGPRRNGPCWQAARERQEERKRGGQGSPWCGTRGSPGPQQSQPSTAPGSPVGRPFPAQGHRSCLPWVLVSFPQLLILTRP